MVAAARTALPRALCQAGLALAVILLQPVAGPAQAPPAEDGLFITMPNPLTGEAVKRLKATTERALQRDDRPIRKLIYDFNPNGRPSETTDYGPCRDLAAFLLEVQTATTVAFVHNEVTGHAVLPVLACKEIVLAPDAKLGDVLRDQPRPLLNDQVQFYEYVAAGRGRCPAIVRKMLDKDVAVVEGTRRGGVWYIDRRRQQEEVQQGFVPTRLEPVLPAGDIGLYSAAQAQQFGLCNLIKATRQEVAEAYQLTPSSLREDPLEGRDPIAERIVIREPVSKAFRETLERRIRQAIGRRANLIFLELRGGGGDTLEARTLAEFLRGLKDDSGDLPVMTVAYIPERAPGAATFLALGCTEIVMAKDAELGDFEPVVSERRGGSPVRWQAIEESLVGLAQEQGYSPLLAQGMLDRRLTIYQVQSQKGAPERRLITEEELQHDQAGPRKWGQRKLIKAGGPNGKLLKLQAQQAKELGLAREVVNGWPDVCSLYGLERERVRDASSDFLYELALFLRHPLVAVFLVMIGVACLILELKIPGVGLPGVIAALCFVLYFWAHSQLAGQILMLAILLFILGLILIGVEVFLLPGSAVMGISGIVLVIVSLGLATLEKKPETTQEWLSFGQTLGSVGLGLVGAVALAFVIAWYLPSIPYASRLVLAPPPEAGAGAAGEEPAASVGPTQAEAAALLGAIGVAATPLRPAGIARFGDAFVDVVTEGGYVPAGSRVQVIEIEGYRVVVKEV